MAENFIAKITSQRETGYHVVYCADSRKKVQIENCLLNEKIRKAIVIPPFKDGYPSKKELADLILGELSSIISHEEIALEII